MKMWYTFSNITEQNSIRDEQDLQLDSSVIMWRKHYYYVCDVTHPLSVDDDVLEAADEEVGSVRERRVRRARRAQPRGRERRHGRVVRLVLADGVDGLLLVGRQHQVRRVYRHEHLTDNQQITTTPNHYVGNLFIETILLNSDTLVRILLRLV